jgi:RNA polymerase sigma-70 factor (sigma-E family)
VDILGRRRAERDAEFVALYDAAWPRLYRVAVAVSGDPATAEDAVQEVLARAYATWPRVAEARHPHAYLRRMVLHDLVDRRRRGPGLRERATADVPETGRSGHADAVDRRTDLWAAVQALPVGQRAVLVLRYWEDCSEAETAEALGVSPGTVKSQTSRALAALRGTRVRVGEERS